MLGLYCTAPASTADAIIDDQDTSNPLRRSEAFFGVHFDLHTNAGDTILGKHASGKNIGDFLEAVKPDFVQYDCKGHPGYTSYPTGIGYASPGIVKDALALWRDETRKRSVGLYVHYSGVMDAAAITHHPEWARVAQDGTADAEVTSLFSEYAEKLMIPQLIEVADRYELDGVWVDGDCWGAKLDYGTTPVLQWKKATGYNTVPREPGDPHWQEWKSFHRDAFCDYLEHWVKALHSYNRNLQVCSNWAYTPHMPLKIEADVDFLSGDFSAKDSADRARFEARYLDSTGLPWDLMAWGFNGYLDNPGAVPQFKHAEQLKQEAGVVLAVGGGVQVYYQPTRGGYVPEHIKKTAQQVAEFCRERQKLSHKTKSVPQIGLLLSTTSYLHMSDNVFSPHGQYNALEGALHSLLENGYSVDLLSEHQLDPVMHAYPVIALAQAPELTSQFRDRLLDYVRKGGSLILLDRESCEPFRNDLGVKFLNEPVQDNAYISDSNSIAPVPGMWQNVQPVAAQAIADRYGRDWVGGTTAVGEETVAGEVAATSITLGAGSIIAVYGPVTQAYFQTHNPMLRNWIGEIVSKSFSVPKARLTNNANVDMSLRRTEDGREVVHLVNLAGAQRAGRFAAIDTIPPSGAIRLDWILPKRPQKMKLFPDGTNLPFSCTEFPDGTAKVTVDIADVNLHGIIVPEY